MKVYKSQPRYTLYFWQHGSLGRPTDMQPRNRATPDDAHRMASVCSFVVSQTGIAVHDRDLRRPLPSEEVPGLRGGIVRVWFQGRAYHPGDVNEVIRAAAVAGA